MSYFSPETEKKIVVIKESGKNVKLESDV